MLHVSITIGVWQDEQIGHLVTIEVTESDGQSRQVVGIAAEHIFCHVF